MLFKPFSFHKLLLEQNNIQITDNQLKYHLDIVRNHNYPLDNIYLQNCFNYNFNLTKNLNYLNLPFILAKIEYFNLKKIN